METQEVRLSEVVQKVIELITSMTAAEARELAEIIRKDPSGKIVYNAFYGSK